MLRWFVTINDGWWILNVRTLQLEGMGSFQLCTNLNVGFKCSSYNDWIEEVVDGLKTLEQGSYDGLKISKANLSGFGMLFASLILIK